MIEDLERVAGVHLNAGATGEAIRLIQHVRAQIAKMDEQYWREKLDEEVMRKFGHILGGQNEAGGNDR